jgi:putative ABC transport system substrate-binding protein
LPTIFSWRADAQKGGLMSYGQSAGELRNVAHQIALYTARILRGAKAGDLPVMQATKFEFVVNLRTAKALGISVPPSLLAIADEVIE